MHIPESAEQDFPFLSSEPVPKSRTDIITRIIRAMAATIIMFMLKSPFFMMMNTSQSAFN